MQFYTIDHDLYHYYAWWNSQREKDKKKLYVPFTSTAYSHVVVVVVLDKKITEEVSVELNDDEKGEMQRDGWCCVGAGLVRHVLQSKVKVLNHCNLKPDR